MDYGELYDLESFQRNMRKTPWLKLFPHWWSETDPLLNAIGDEIERIKAQAIFGLLNAGLKPPVLLWKESLKHKVYNVNKDITHLPSIIPIRAPFYKTWGTITLTNNTEDDIDGIEITFDGENGFLINQLISQSDIITIDLTNDIVKINNKKIKPHKIGQGMPYFITSKNHKTYKENTPLHNEIIRLKINTDINLENKTTTQQKKITENLEQWTVVGNAYQYNKEGTDSYIALEKDARITYELDFNNISDINFWYKSEGESELKCYADNNLIFSKKPTDDFVNYTIDTHNIQTTRQYVDPDTRKTTTEEQTISLEGVSKLEFEHANGDGIIYINDIQYTSHVKYNSECDINVNVNMDDAVFIDEQNIEVTGLELIPIERVDLYAKYNFEHNKSRNGWQKVYQKKYEENTNVIYDMITTHFYAKEFYVEVWFKTLQYPYKVAFPADKNAQNGSMYHVNNRLDEWGTELGLKRRIYKTDIDEKKYAKTFPIYYPFNIEQDYWYYKRLVNEYTTNDLAINDIDIKDTEGNNVLRLYSINPFCEDFVVHAKSNYAIDKEFIDYNQYYPVLITQKPVEGYIAQSEYNNIINLLGNNDNTSKITLNNKTDNDDIIYRKREPYYRKSKNYDDDYTLTDNDIIELQKQSTKDIKYIKSSGYISRDLLTFFDLIDLPDNVNIDDIEVVVEGESTDNKDNKYNNERTGLIIPTLEEDNEIFIPLIADKTYQLKKEKITYSIEDKTLLQKIISGTDKNIIQKAIVGIFSADVNTTVKIPFKLIENDEIVDDITDVWIYFNDTLKTGKIETNDNGETYICVTVPKQPLTTQIKIECKSEKHMPFVGTIDITKKDVIIKDDNGNDIIDHQYIEGPISNGSPVNIELVEEWHTKDIRNIIQKQGIFFRNVLENNDEQSSTTIILHNIKLIVKYSPKKSIFKLKTHVNLEKPTTPYIGAYEVNLINIGEKPLKTSIDIITPPNIVLDKNYIDIDLNPGEEIFESINILPEYPIVDATYDIIAMCDDVINRDSINTYSEGLIQTSVSIRPHHGKYNENITLSAKINSIDKAVFNGNSHKVNFYINDFLVTNEPITVINNEAHVTITPSNYSFTGTGVLKLEARYLGNVKYASSRANSTIFISKNSTKMTLYASKQGIYKKSYTAQAIVEYFDGESYTPVNDGIVEFYIQSAKNDEILSTNTIPDYQTGTFNTSIESLENLPGEYKLYAQYTGSDTYSSTEEIQDFEIIGGDVNILGFDDIVYPHNLISLKAKILDMNNKPISSGFVDFKSEDLNINCQNIPVKNGNAITDEFELDYRLSHDDETKMYKIDVIYHGIENDENNIYNEKESTLTLTIQKADVLIEHQPLYRASQREPLGFLVKVKDAQTNKYVQDGKVIITLPSQNNLKIEANVDEDGVARIVHNAINFSAQEWRELLKWSFSTAFDNTRISIENIENYDESNLYAVYNGLQDEIELVDFALQDNNLFYYGNQHDNKEEVIRNDIDNHIYIKDDYIFAKTDADTLRNNITGLQDLKIEYQSEYQYKSQTINLIDGLNIESQQVNLDIHSYDISYTDTEGIICYISQYDESNIPIQYGEVEFIIDDKSIATISVINGEAVLPVDNLHDISAGKHLLEVNYIENNKHTTRSFSILNLRKQEPLISISSKNIAPNKNAKIYINFESPNNINVPLNGNVILYLNDEKIGEQYLYGNESLTGIVDYDDEIDEMIDSNFSIIFNYIMPNDINIPNEYEFKVIYEGNDFYTPLTRTYPVDVNKYSVDIISSDIDINNINTAINQSCNINFQIYNTEVDDDIVNDGTLMIKENNDNIIAQGNVINGEVNLVWTPTEIQSFSYILEYTNSEYYKDSRTVINLNVIEPEQTIILDDNNNKTIHEALMYLANDGTIYIEKDIELHNSLIINQNCNIIGANDIKIINQSIDNINIINNKRMRIDNVHFISDDSNMSIVNNDYLFINHSILDKNINLNNNKTLIAQCNFIYGECTGNSELNNNWWGSNTPPYNVDNHIIIKIEPLNKPAVISENVDIIGKMIGANGREYSLPNADFVFGADSGYFSVDFGKLSNHQVQTTYFDADQEGHIYFTVDNETVSYPIYSYERKTEVIIDDIDEIPVNHQVQIKAKVQSCADIYYDFDKDNNVQKSTTAINNGYILFYIDNKQIGSSRVQNGEAEVVLFTKNYNIDTIYTVKAIYKPDEYYFSSEDTQEISIISGDNCCYVSYWGNDNDSGSYDSPFKTIQKAIDSGNGLIYLLSEEYDETNIDITRDVTIKSFRNASTFSNLSETIFNVNNPLTLEKINFLNNSSIVFSNEDTLNLTKCILYNNQTLFNTTENVNAQQCAIVDNETISNTEYTGTWATFCWFGENNPEIDGIDKYIQMTVEKSKENIYVGSTAQVTALLDTYKSGRLTYKLNKPLPLRIAKFATTYGSFKPIKDYTYRNKSTSLLNTNEENNTTQYVITIPENKNYINHKVTLQCNINDVYGEPVQSAIEEAIEFYVTGPNTNIKKYGSINNGVSAIEINKLGMGTYLLTCSYKKNGQIYTSQRDFIITKPKIIVKDFTIDDKDHLYYTDINATLEDNFGNKIDKEYINIKIDDEFIAQVFVENGTINKHIEHKFLTKGNHTIQIDNINTISQYEIFKYYYEFESFEKKVDIEFDYINFEVKTFNTIEVSIVDDEGNKVNEGYINIELDNEEILSNKKVVNGSVSMNNFIINDIGQHSIIIYYSGVNGHYKEKLYVKNNIGAGIFNVNFGIKEDDILKADIGKIFNFETSVTDISGQPVNDGYVNLYIDDILFNKTPIYIRYNKLSIKQLLPTNIASGLHRLRLEYIDNSDTYLDTFLSLYLKVGKIQTSIYTDIIVGQPNQSISVDYQVQTMYGNANSGTLIARYDGKQIGKSIITDNIMNQIVLKLPYLPSGDYEIDFEFEDEKTYESSQLSNRLIMNKGTVNISPSHTWYYPSRPFHLNADFTDINGDIIKTGKATLYIDNVQETELQNVQFGKISLPLQFNQAKIYHMSIVYEENEYYEYTSMPFDFKIDSADIENISFKDKNTDQDTYYINNNTIYSLPYQKIESELVFNTLDNIDVTDGIVDIFINDKFIRSYYIPEGDKYIDFNIENLNKGEHTIKIKYHDSLLFNDYEKEITLIILSKQVLLKITTEDDNFIHAQDYTDTISIETKIYDIENNPLNLNGILRYYIGLPIYRANEVGETFISDYDYKFIGVQEINNINVDTYEYTLPPNLLEYSIEKYETQYVIKSEFIGNNEYDESSTQVGLKITKTAPEITFIDNNNLEITDMEADYGNIINIKLQTNLLGSPLINLYIDNDPIGTIMIQDGIGELSYKLSGKYKPKEGTNVYSLRAQFKGSAVNTPQIISIPLTIHPFTPILDTSFADEVYYGGVLQLNNVVKNMDNSLINTGMLKYIIDNQEHEYNVNTDATINLSSIVSGIPTLTVEYTSNSENYNNFTKDIELNMKKNKVQMVIEAPKESYREQIDINIIATSSTTNLPVDIIINKNEIEYEMTNGNITIQHDISLDNNNIETIEISSIENDIFESITATTEIQIINQNTVTVDNNVERETASITHNLQKALSLVNDYGTIVIKSVSGSEDVVIDKGVTIIGEDKPTLSAYNIVNQSKEVTIQNIKFTDTIGTCIENHGDLIVKECDFESNKNSAITTYNKIIVENCTFKDNTAQNGAGIYIANKNYHTEIIGCSFNGNEADVYGSCIYSNKGNDVTIKDNAFYNNKGNGVSSSCIYVNGNTHIIANMFYDNDECQYEIYLLDGTISMDNNIFDGSIISTKIMNGSVDADYNYWGYNSIDKIENNNSDLININNWLISRVITYKEEDDDENTIKITCVIDRYINRLENQFTSIEAIQKNFPVYIDTNLSTLNEKYKASSVADVIIGKELFQLGDEDD